MTFLPLYLLTSEDEFIRRPEDTAPGLPEVSAPR